MLNRIYTRSAKEATWKQKGLLRVLKSDSQEALAIASKEYIESLRCYSEVRRLLAAGKSLEMSPFLSNGTMSTRS